MAVVVSGKDCIGARIAECLGLNSGVVLGIDIHVKPGELLTADVRVMVTKERSDALLAIVEEMAFVGIKKKEPSGCR